MKHKTSISLDEETLIGIRELLRDSSFRNKSHLMEFAIKKLIEERNGKP